MESSPPCIVRKAGPEDLLAVVRIIDRAPDLPVEGLTALHRSTWTRMMMAPDLTVYVADSEQEIVGTTSLLVMPHVTYGCRPTAFIEPMVVTEGRRRRGIGRMLTERALDDARALGCHKVQVVSHKRHAGDGAHDFYVSLGFVPEAEGFRMYV